MTKHSVIVLTYNQENLLPIALESLFNQTIQPYEVIISDDCSTDNTWDVILKYAKLYPLIIKPKRNSTNFGVFGNFNSTLQIPTGDIVSLLAGDDYYKPGIFESFNNLIVEKKINPQIESFIIISNAIDLFTSGNEKIFNNYKLREKDLFKLKIRYDINFRETGFSIKLFKRLSPIREDLGIYSDRLFCLDQITKSENFYFINKAFSVYRKNVGIVSKTNHHELAKSMLKVIDIIKEIYREKLDKRDQLYLKYELSIYHFEINKNLSNYLTLFYYYIINIWNFTPNTRRKNLRFFLYYTYNYFIKR